MKLTRSHILALLLAVISLVDMARADATKPKFLDGIGIDQNLGAQIPMDLMFHDEKGNAVRLGDYFDGSKKPVILTLVYYKCPSLCTLVLNDLNRGMNGITMSAGEDFNVVTISFDPHEGPELAADKKEIYMQSYRRPKAAEGWHFLTGDEESLKKLTSVVGFHYRYDPKFQQYVHPSGLIVLTPKGVVSRYFFGIDYDLKDLRLALEEASSNKIGGLTDRLLLYCFHYDPETGKYSVAVIKLMQVGAVLTMGALGAFWFAMSKKT
jgi:protein SCO1/2